MVSCLYLSSLQKCDDYSAYYVSDWYCRQFLVIKETYCEQSYPHPSNAHSAETDNRQSFQVLSH